MTVLSKNHQGKEQEEERCGCDGGKIKWKLSEVNTGTVSQGQYELIGEFKIAADKIASIRG